LFQNEDLFIYRPVKNEQHLAIKFERTDAVLNESAKFKLYPSSRDSDVKMIKSAVVKCTNCNNPVAFRIHCGPNHDSLLCISMKTTFNVLADGSRLTNSSCGGGPMRKKILEQFLEERDITEFYGTQIKTIKSDSLVGSLTHPSIEDLIKLELEMNSLVKDKPRSYQVECFCAAAMFPSIIQIPTGSGKTHVSAMLTALYKRLNPNRMVWFLTDRIPLVFQQARYIEEQTSLTVLPLAGDVQTSLKPSQLIKYDVMVCTVQLLINMLVIGQIRIDDVSLIIIDEIHHAVKNHPYVIFIETFLSSRIGNDRPRLLGLTASPASGNPIQMKLQLRDLSRLCGAQLYTPCIYRNDLASAVNRPKTKFIPVDLTSGDSALSQLLFDNIRELLIDESCPCSNLEDVRNNLRGLTVKSRQDHLLSAKLYKVHHFLTALEMTSILGSRYSQSYVIDLLKYGGIDQNLTPLEEKVLQMCRDEEKTTISPKVRALCKILESIDLVAAPETRMIVFVETKRTARWLASFLQEHLTNSGLNEWNPTAFTGQASNTVEGMNWIDEQRPILALFRSGHIKLLVATSVLQEGLDVAACNHIVLFDRTWSLKAFLQSRGRARAQDSEYTIICSADDENYYEKLFKQEIILSKMVRDEMVDAKVLSLELVMTTIHLNVKCGKLQFATAKLSAEDDGNGIFNTPLEAQENSLEEDEDGGDEYNLTVNVHNAQTETFDEPCQLNIIGIERKRDHLLFFADKEEISVIIELPAILLKSIRRSWIQSTEELLDPLIRERFPDALIELDKLIPDLLIGFNNVPLFNSIVMELQKLAVGLLDSGNKFIETASQHHSFTPSMSQIIFEPLSRKINVIFQESLDEMTTTFRIEISFDTIDSFCLLARNCSSNEEENGDNNYDDSNFSLILPLKTPPLLFMATEEISKFEIEKKIDEIYWERVTANSFSSRLSEVFSSCPAIKFDLFLNGMTSRKLFQILLKFGVNILYTCNLEVDCFPEFHSLWLMKIEKFFKYLDFETQYRLRAIISETWSRTSLRITSEWLERASKVSQGTLELFNKKLARNRFVDLLECLKSCEALKLPQKDKLIPNNNVQGSLSVKLITWTPSRILLHNPTIFLSNRVLRHFGPDHFIRVHFRDEDFIKLSTIRSNASIENLLHVGVKGILDNGITIGNKKFEFLAMSSSQLRGHGCWFVDSEIGADNIRSWLGTFNDINNVAKYVARLGQSFSASRPTLSVSTFASVPDWKANDFCFSDGCGMIPPQLAQEIALKLNLSQVPAAFQIRFAGFKGVVAVNPEIKELSLRLSMKKFDSTHPSLDVLNIAEAFPCYLNRQVIMILSALGVPDSAFEKLQMNHLKYLAECFNSNGTLSLKDLNISDLDPRDPFMRSLISSQYRQQLTDLLTKSRIIVPKGRIIMGVIDETGILAEDEIFCQIRDDQMNKVVEGKVTVAKNPCMHPGDVRVLKAIRDPVLESYSYNVIVFSRNGPRPVPNMCSGSDLDGDLYFVTWDESLIPPQVDEPMDYDDGLSAKVKSGPITVEDLKEFMVFFIENDKLGAIANTHVAFADQLEAGVRDPACKALAKLFSYAVDFAKTGYVASIPKEVRVEKFPDFMMKPHKPSYASHRIIGTLFREIKAIINEDVSDDFSGNILVNSEFLTPGYEVKT
jgi:ERCC4-related helicase